MSLIITQGFGSGGGGDFTGTFAGSIPDYSSNFDTYLISVDSTLTVPISIEFLENITGFPISSPNQ